MTLVPILSLSLVSCEPDDGVEDIPSVVDPEDKDESESKEETDGDASDASGEGAEAEDPTSAVAVTGLVDKFGCTYADISGYANLNLLPMGAGTPVIGVELVEAAAENNVNARPSTTTQLVGNIYTVSFSDLVPDTEYKYRAFVTYSGEPYYGKYKTLTTKEVVGIASTGEASEVKYNSAVLSASVQTEGIDSRDNVYVGFAWSTSESDLCADGNFESTKTSVHNITDDVYSVSLSGLSYGTTYYYASFTKVGDVYVFSSVKKFTTVKLPEGAVDLGLPSGLLWASCNVGAESPEEYGDYFAWGETTTKSSYTTSNSVTYDLSYNTLQSRGIIADGNLTAAYDAATANWGDNWRMPTKAEQDELRTECTWKWTTQNGVYGRKVTGPNGNSIFLPAAGYRLGTSLNGAGSNGYYWSATPYSHSSSAYDFYFTSFNYDWNFNDRGHGQTVRPVSE